MDADLGYKSLILKNLSFGETLNAFELSKTIQRSLPLTKRILNELIDQKLVEEHPQAQYTGGRRAAAYSIRSNTMYVLSVSMDQYITRICLVDLGTRMLFEDKSYSLTLDNSDNDASQLIILIQKYLKESKISSEEIIGIGVGMPGIIDLEKGINYTYFNYREEKGYKSLRDYLTEQMGMPCFIDNDSTAIAMAEYMIGPKPQGKNNNSLIVNFGWGMGLGMILKGERYKGSMGLAGEFSHIPLFDNNKLCRCGKTGCMETETSLLAIVERFRRELEKGRVSQVGSLPDNLEKAISEIILALKHGDSLAIEIFTDVAYNLGRGIAILIQILNPDQIIISGRGAEAGSIILAPINEAVNKFCIPRLATYTTISVSTMAGDAEIFGAASILIDNIDNQVINLSGIDPKPLKKQISHL